VTLIVGGGFHGKTTLLKAVECGIYNKVQTSWVLVMGSAVVPCMAGATGCGLWHLHQGAARWRLLLWQRCSSRLQV
jgi:hypothetical protein